MSRGRDDPGVVVVKATGGAGLGDLIRALLAGLHYAVVTGRGVVPRWDDGLYGPAGVDVFPQLLELVGVHSPGLADLDADDVAPAAWRGRLHLPFGRVYALERDDDWSRSWALAQLSFDQTRFDYREAVLVMWEFDRFPAAWSAAAPSGRVGAFPEDALRLLARRRLRPALAVLARVQAVYERFSGHMIGVHVRKTFEKGGASRHTELASIFNLLDRLRGDGTGIFLATDNREVEAVIRERYPSVVTTSKWFGAAGVALHFDDQAPDRTRGAIEAMTDLYLLAACDALIHPAESSFSRVAAILGDMPPARVYGALPGPRTWRRRLREGLWAVRARRGLAGVSGARPYFLQP